MKIYIAAPLFSEGERSFNEHIYSIISGLGHEVFLPQHEGGPLSDLPDQIGNVPKEEHIFQLDLKKLNWCDVLLVLLDGRVPDEGACFELGYCYAARKKCIGYKTDVRFFADQRNNLMLDGALDIVLKNEADLKAYFSRDRL